MEPVYSKWWMPTNISSHGGEVDGMMVYLHIFMAALFVGWGIFFVYCLVAYRQRPGHKARYAEVSGSISKAVEIGVVVVEAVLLVAFSMPVWAQLKNEFPKDADAEHVRIVAQQFQWNFHYPGKDGKFGRTDVNLVDEVDNPLGIDRSDPDAKDDFYRIGVLTIPVDKPIIARLTSKDVVHSFKMPAARFTHDVNPGVAPRIWFKIVKTGKYDIACAQLCGVGHTRMRAALDVLPAEEYASWYEKNSPKAR